MMIRYLCTVTPLAIVALAWQAVRPLSAQQIERLPPVVTQQQQSELAGEENLSGPDLQGASGGSFPEGSKPESSATQATEALSQEKGPAFGNPDPLPRLEPLPRPKEPQPKLERLPPPGTRDSPSDGGFPALPPDPYEDDKPPLPPLEEELWHHGGSQLYQPEGDRLGWPDQNEAHYDYLRLPEDWQEPQPLSWPGEYLGSGPIQLGRWKWPGLGGYVWEPRFVGYGSYSLIAFALEENNRRQDAIGHNLLIDLDLQLTGTERLHVQFRPIGRRNTGGSFYQFSNPEGFEDNSTLGPDRYWIEAELASVLGAYLDPFSPLDINLTAGRFPFALHNRLLLNTDLVGAVVSKNNIYWGDLSNLNLQAFFGKNDVNAFANADGQIWGLHATADRQTAFIEATYAFLRHDFNSTHDAHYLALSRTKLYGPLTLAARALAKWGDRGGSGDGQLFVAETAYERYLEENCAGIEKATFFCNVFWANDGWSSMGGGNFNRLRNAFEVNPLVRISAGRPVDDTWGAALGVQLFRLHEDESLIPEIAYESPGGEPVWGLGLRYLRQLGPRRYIEALGVANFSDDSRYRREGLFVTHVLLF